MYSFGSGVLIGQRTDIPGATPLNFGLLQEVSIEESASTKSLMGQFQRPVAIARGAVKTTGKAKVARISGLAFGHLYYGVAPVPGQIATSFAEAWAVPAAPGAGAGVTVQGAATFIEDAGVTFAATGLPLQAVAGAPGEAQYSVAAGVYVFSAADAGKGVLISYSYELANVGQRFAVGNPLMGSTPTFKAKFWTTFQGAAVSLQLNNCVSTKFGFATKLEDFVLPEFDFEAFADASNSVLTWSFGEAS